jgi:hypothetical protein
MSLLVASMARYRDGSAAAAIIEDQGEPKKI